MKRVFAPVPNYFGGSMKKISAVLLVLVLVGSVAFAGFTGSASTEFGVSLDDGNFGFTNEQVVSVDLVILEALGEATGEGDIYADIAASFTFGIETDDDVAGVVNGDFYADVDFDYAKIVGDNWFVGILGSMAAPNFAASAIDEDSDEDALDLIADFGGDAAGLTVGVADFEFGLGLPYNKNVIKKDATVYDVTLTAKTPEFEFADGLTAAFGAGVLIETDETAIVAGLTVGYEVDELAIGVDADLGYEVDGDFDAEVALNAVYDFVTFDAYFATAATEDVYGNGAKNILSVKAAAEIDAFTVELTGKDLINTTAIGLSVDWDATDELSANVNGGYTVQGKDEGDWYAGAGVTYTVDAFEAGLSGTYKSAKALELEAYISSETLVDGAELKLGWSTDDVLTELGKVVASVSIAF